MANLASSDPAGESTAVMTGRPDPGARQRDGVAPSPAIGGTSRRYPYHQWSPDARALDIVGDKWTLLIARDLQAGPRRFVELGRVLPGISTEQLRARLGSMVAAGLVTRMAYREAPPRVDYELTPRGRGLAGVLAALARWGYDWAWSTPREGEAIDIGAILRLAPGLVEAPPALTATAELTVTGEPPTVRAYALTVAGGQVAVREGSWPAADARISGSQDDWIAALGPDGRFDALVIDGDRALASLLLDGIAARSRRQAAPGAVVSA